MVVKRNNIAQHKTRIKIEISPEMLQMVVDGSLIYKDGWYEATSKEAYDAIIRYISLPIEDRRARPKQ